MSMDVQYFAGVMPCCVTSRKAEMLKNIRPYKNASQETQKISIAPISSFVIASFFLKIKMFSPDDSPSLCQVFFRDYLATLSASYTL